MNGDKNNASGTRSSRAGMNDLRLEAARKRLSESRSQEDAIEGLREIVATFLGSEEIGLFRVERRTATFQIYWSFGIDVENYDLVRAMGEAGVQHVMRGECHVVRPDRHHSGAMVKVQAYIPIRFANQTVAILAILRLLPQKVAFDQSDMELFKLLSDEAAKPLFGSSVHSTVVEGPGMRT
ncbi:MAG: GAF domain-containing protein [Terriglobales bacterium]|jgi:GAF domain-containing protein